MGGETSRRKKVSPNRTAKGQPRIGGRSRRTCPPAAVRRYDGRVSRGKRRPAAKAGVPAKSAGRGRRAGLGDQKDQAFAELWAAITAGDVLHAEIQTSVLVALTYQFGGSDERAEMVIRAFIDDALEQDGPVAAAFLRLLMSLGTRSVKRIAGDALASLIDHDVYPPQWVNSIGKPAPGQAWRIYDVFGDHEVIAVTFSYPDEAEHVLIVGMELIGPPTVSMAVVSPDGAGLLKMVREELQPWDRIEEISLTQARGRVEEPLARATDDPVIELGLETALQLPTARCRVRRLPSGGVEQVTGYTAADRAEAVEEFLRSPHAAQAAQAGDPEVARFWAEVLTGYSSRVPGTPPAQAGPNRLVGVLLGHVPSTFTLSPAQREGMEAAVGAWARWSAAHQDLDEAAAGHLLARLPETFADFPDAYDDAESVAARAYVRDIAASDVDVAWLTDCRNRREVAVTPPADHDPGTAAADADVTDAGGRAVLTAHEFASCAPEGPAGERFMTAAKRVVEELWHDDPPATWQTAKAMLAKGLDPHEVIHRLVEASGKPE